jgi:hypothetical protein
MLESLITSKTRIKLLMKLFLNSENTSHLRGMERDFGESTNAVRMELNRFVEAGLLQDEYVGKKRFFKANTKHPLFGDIQNILRKVVGIDKIIDKVTSQIGNLDAAYVTGSFAEGMDSDTIELVLIGNDLDAEYINNLVKKAKDLIERNIVYLVMTFEQFSQFFKDKPILLIWKQD